MLSLEFQKNKRLTASELGDDDIPILSLFDTEITNSISSPLSDKLLLLYTNLSNAVGLKNYGVAISKNLCRDVSAKFMRLTAGIGKYANVVLELTIKHGWLEEPPTCPNRKMLFNAVSSSEDSQ
jgi:hypothetical protein